MTRIGLIGAGAMGAAIGARLVQAGASVVAPLAGRSAASRERALAAGIEDRDHDALAGADLVLSIVPPSVAEAVFAAHALALGAEAQPPLYIDCNAVSPSAKRRLATEAGRAGCPFLDGAIIGPPSKEDGRDPTILLSGEGAGDAAERLAVLGLDARVVHGPIGSAAAVKLCHSGLSKGLSALAVAMLGAAGRAGVGDDVRAMLEERLPSVLTRLRRTVPAMYPKAHRWVAEMKEIADFLADDAGAAIMFEAAARVYQDRADAFVADRVEAAAVIRLLGGED